MIRAACVQMCCLLGKPEENTKRMIDDIRHIKADAPDTDLIVFPECAIDGYECDDSYEATAETAEGAHIASLCATAQEQSVLVVAGFVERAVRRDAQVLYNTAVLIERDGSIVGTYRKTHLVDGMEKRTFAAGDAYPVFDTSIGRVGLMICWDSVFPEVARILALQGAKLIIVPEAVEKGIEREWSLALTARAFDNGVFVLSCNHVGTDRTLTYFGESMLVAPDGGVRSKAGDSETVLFSEIELAETEAQQAYFPMLADCRPELYMPNMLRAKKKFTDGCRR